MRLFAQVRRRLFVFQVLLLLVGSCAVAYCALQVFERDVRPEMTRKGDLIAGSLARQFERALALGDTFERLRGVEELFGSMRAENSEIVFILAAGENGGRVFHDGKAERSVALNALEAVRDARAGAPEPDRTAVSEAVRWGGFLITSRPIVSEGHRVGRVLVGVDERYVQQQMSEMFYDSLVVLLVSLLVTFELLVLIMSRAAAPMVFLQQRLAHGGFDDGSRERGKRQLPRDAQSILKAMREIVARLNERQAALVEKIRVLPPWPEPRLALDECSKVLRSLGKARGDEDVRNTSQRTLVGVRMPLFVFFLAEELSRSFFPIYARGLYRQIDGLSPEIVISLPMMLFMLVVAVTQPLGGPWVERLGSRKMVMFGAVLGAVGLALTAFADSLWTLMIWRLIAAAGYGIVFAAGQSYVVANTDASNRAWGLAMFVGSVLAASICGPAIGGILADRVGYRMTFAVGAGLAILAALIAFKMLDAPHGRRGSAARALRLRDVMLVLRNPRFVSLVSLGAMPAKIILTGFLYYLAPLYLADLGNSPSATGQIMMLYGLMMVLFTPIAARLVDRIGHRLLFVSLGGLLSGAGVIAISALPSTAMMLSAIVVLGIAQAISITPQLALVPIACSKECAEIGQATVMGFFRLFERLGSALGPPIAAFLLLQFGFVSSIVAIGCGVAAGCLLLPLFWRAKLTDTSSEAGVLAAR
jgi:predicted MFS family arabinose efflux permease